MSTILGEFNIALYICRLYMYHVNIFGIFVSSWKILTLGGSLGVLACVFLDCPWTCLLLVPDNDAPFIITSWALLTAPYCGSPPVWPTQVCKHCASLPWTLSSVFFFTILTLFPPFIFLDIYSPWMKLKYKALRQMI